MVIVLLLSVLQSLGDSIVQNSVLMVVARMSVRLKMVLVLVKLPTGEPLVRRLAELIVLVRNVPRQLESVPQDVLPVGKEISVT